MRTALTTLLAGMLGGCAAAPIRHTTSSSHGAVALGVSIKGRELPKFRRHRAEVAFFARVEPDGRLDVDRPLRSHLAAGGWVYLLDVPPGRYAPISVGYIYGRTPHMARLEPRLSLEWIAEVGPGQLAFAGDNFLYEEFTGWSAVFFNALKNTAAYLPPFKTWSVPIVVTSPRSDRTVRAEVESLRVLEESLPGTLWKDAARRRLQALGDPPRPVMRGFWRKKPAERIKTESFSYIDTLEWGLPRKISGGLEWMHPKGKARVAVSFRPEGEPGYRLWDKYLQELKEAGSPEDSHQAVEIFLSSRTSYAVRYTTYRYPEPYLVGSLTDIFVTEVVLMPDPGGFYLMHYRAYQDEFRKFHAAFKKFISHVVPERPARNAE